MRLPCRFTVVVLHHVIGAYLHAGASIHCWQRLLPWFNLTAGSTAPRNSAMLKIIIVLLLIAIIASLFSGAVFFFRDQGSTKRTLYALGVRVTLAVLLIITISYGVFSGQLRLNAPWLQAPSATTSAPANP
jgi:hypothetical protein